MNVLRHETFEAASWMRRPCPRLVDEFAARCVLGEDPQLPPRKRRLRSCSQKVGTTIGRVPSDHVVARRTQSHLRHVGVTFAQ